LLQARYDQGYGSDTDGPDGEGKEIEIILPPFPPTDICLKRAFANAIELVAPDVVMIWSFCTSFPELLGLSPSTTLEQLFRAIVEGSGSRLLGEVHMALIRLVLVSRPLTNLPPTQSLNLLFTAHPKGPRTFQSLMESLSLTRSHLSNVAFDNLEAQVSL
jgi:hypothetical protein